MPLYFAYGTNMDVAAMRLRCPNSTPLSTATLARHRLAVTDEGYFTVVRDPRADVHGVLFDLALGDVPALDRYEEVGRGLYAKVMQPVLRAPGGSAQAMIYIGRTARDGAARADHLAIVERAARQSALPARYVAGLARFARSRRPDR